MTLAGNEVTYNREAILVAVPSDVETSLMGTSPFVLTHRSCNHDMLPLYWTYIMLQT
jgi:hypothetical protein